MKSIVVTLVLVICSTATAQIGGRCENCELMYDGMPAQPSWDTIVADAHEPGEPLVVSGRVFKRDGKAPAAGVILYVYQTNAKGLYSPAPNQKHGRKHGHLRGWMKTNERGEYRFRTIRPASYPDSRIESHIHAIVKEPDKNEYYIDDYLFEGDPFLTADVRGRLQQRGGSGIIAPKKRDGILSATRDIVLGLNVPGYP